MIDMTKRFICGEPCAYGHIPQWRYKSSKECCECVRLRVAKQRRQGKRQTVNSSGVYERGTQ